MNIEGAKIGFGLTGSFCMYEKIFCEIQNLVDKKAVVYTIFSTNSQNIDCRFGNSKDFIDKAYKLTGNKPITTIEEAEPVGPKNMFDILLIAPCTGNTIAKLANAITDTPVLMAAKSHIRNNKPIVIFLSTNDALGLNLKNIGTLLNTKDIYFVPFGQDNYKTKPKSMVSHINLIVPTIVSAFKNVQIQPIIKNHNT